MDDPSHSTRPYKPSRPYSAEPDPLVHETHNHEQAGALMANEYGSTDRISVATGESMEILQEPDGQGAGVRVLTPTREQCPGRCTSPTLGPRYRRPENLSAHNHFANGEKVSSDTAVEDKAENLMRKDVEENRCDDERNLDLQILHYLQNIKAPAPQIMRRFILACMEKKVTEKDLLWSYHIRDCPQNGTLPQKTFLAITKQHFTQNSQLTDVRDYQTLAESYLGFDGDFVRYVDLCNDLHSWRVLCNNYKEFPLRQIYPPYRHPHTEYYPQPPQGDWPLHLETSRRESHQLPTVTFDELRRIPELMKRISEALCQHHSFDRLANKFHEMEKQKENKSAKCALVPHDLVQQMLKEFIPLDISEKDMQTLCLYYEHPYILHFFRYRHFLLDVKFEMALIDPKVKETETETRKRSTMAKLKRHLHTQGLNFLEPFKDFDRLAQGHLKLSQMKRALHVLRIGPGQRCDLSEQDMDFLLDQFCDDGESINYKALNGELIQVFVERFEPRGRLAMLLDSFEPSLARGPFYSPEAPLISKEEILQKAVNDENLLRRVIDRLKMSVAQRRIQIEPIFRVFDPHNIRRLQNVVNFARIMQLAALPVTPEEVDVLLKKFADQKGFRYPEFLRMIDAQSYAVCLPTYPLTVAAMERWKNKRAWFPEVTPQNVHQSYQGPDAIVEKCRRKVSLDRLHVMNFFRDYDIHNRGTMTRKQFRRATAAMGLKLSPMENLILENQYTYNRDIALLDYSKFVADMELVFTPEDVSRNPAKVPERFKFAKINDREPIGSAEIALAQEGFRKLCEKLLELRVHIEPYFVDFDRWRRGGITQERFRRIISTLGFDILSELEWKALFRYFARPSEKCFDYRAFLDKVAGVETKRVGNIVNDPRFRPTRS